MQLASFKNYQGLFKLTNCKNGNLFEEFQPMMEIVALSFSG